MPKYKDTKIRCALRLTQLRSDCSLKISDDKYVAFCIARDFPRVIPLLKPFRLLAHPMPDKGSGNSTAEFRVPACEMNHGDHSVSRIAETKFRSAIAYGARLFAIRRCRQHHDCEMAVGCRKFVSIDVDKVNRIGGAG